MQTITVRPMSTIRRWHFEQLQHSLKTAHYILQTTNPQTLTTYRDNGDGWTVAEVIGHLLDCERLFLERAQLIIAHDCPDLPFPDQDEDVVKGRYNERHPQHTFAEWQQAREEYLAYLNTIPDEAWTRAGESHKFGPFNLNDLLFAICWHDTIHTEQITRILTEKK